MKTFSKKLTVAEAIAELQKMRNPSPGVSRIPSVDMMLQHLIVELKQGDDVMGFIRHHRKILAEAKKILDRIDFSTSFDEEDEY